MSTDEVKPGRLTGLTRRVPYRIPTAQGKWRKKNPVWGKHKRFGNFPKHMISFAQLCRLSDFTDTGYCDIGCDLKYICMSAN